ncbi:plasmid maintenance system killer [Magnetococcus marinus MC-1]|uniref:Plasmid maintenance system killer n=1 Tax=Magnetococcus marinus (strain ATCC BAA-1437 / JCM 17883 / MC-1) TaxID=156889 RepID=A0LBP3_MAGMM|nr:type II toxin-antitoxin system RelE/ParE family toxin [Magnetococcus marinus]ABK45386.1 plasmid maintenance system killer [Magnetococcus marinus MC-1]
MIISFRDKATESLYAGERVKKFVAFSKIALRKLDMLDAAVQLNDLRIPPGNRLEALKHDRVGQHSIRINDQWRICFVWKDDGAHQVEIVDYH